VQSAMNYTLAHLKIAHHAGAKKLSFEQTEELITLLDRNGMIHFSGAAGTKPSRKAQPASKVGKLPKVMGKRGRRRGQLSDKVLNFLKTKGEAGSHVREIAKAVKAPFTSVNVWFYTTGKKFLKNGAIKKIAPATFAHAKS
jgi:hypothetical protein